MLLLPNWLINPPPASTDTELYAVLSRRFMNDHFASSTSAMILSWIVALPAFYVIFCHIVFLFKSHEGVGRWLSIWIGICFLILGPIRYIFFQFVVFSEYPFQSFRAFLSLFGVGILGPFALTLLYGIGFLLPLILMYRIAHVDSRLVPRKALAAVFLAPAMAIFGSFAFSAASPLATKTTQHLDAESLIRATNGPAHLAFACAPSWLTPLPKYVELTDGSMKDLVRAHVASTYLSKTGETYYMKNAYPSMMDDTQIARVLGIQFNYHSDGTPTLTAKSSESLAQAVAQGHLSEEQQHAYNALSARGIVGGGADGGGGGAGTSGAAEPQSIQGDPHIPHAVSCH